MQTLLGTQEAIPLIQGSSISVRHNNSIRNLYFLRKLKRRFRTFKWGYFACHGVSHDELTSVVSDEIAAHFELEYCRVIERRESTLVVLDDVLHREGDIKARPFDAKHSSAS